MSCSVVRRVLLPDAHFAADGVFQTLLDVLGGFGAYPAVIERELRRYLPFLATTKVLMASVRAGVGREVAHEVIKEHAVAVALEMREQGSEGNDLVERLAADDRLGLDAATPRRRHGRAARLRRQRRAAGGRRSSTVSASWRPGTPRRRPTPERRSCEHPVDRSRPGPARTCTAARSATCSTPATAAS